MRTSNLVLVGITGGIGSGKSSLTAYLRSRGAAVVDADQIGHPVIEQASVKRQLLECFGGEIVDESGKIDRRRLGRMAFADRPSYDRLNSIVQPALSAALWKEVEVLRERGAAIVAVEASVLFEWGDRKSYDAVVVVDADEELRVQRVLQRGRLSRQEVATRMAFQLPSDEKRAMADYVIENNGTLHDLERAAERLWGQLLNDSQTSG